jgi:hypothetical protein
MVLSTCSACSSSKRRRAQNKHAAETKNAVFALTFVAHPSSLYESKAKTKCSMIVQPDCTAREVIGKNADSSANLLARTQGSEGI